MRFAYGSLATGNNRWVRALIMLPAAAGAGTEHRPDYVNVDDAEALFD